MSECRSCKAPIMWVKTKSGKNMPIDFDKDIEYLFDGGDPVEFEPELGMRSHFATCPDAHDHRKY